MLHSPSEQPKESRQIFMARFVSNLAMDAVLWMLVLALCVSVALVLIDFNGNWHAVGADAALEKLVTDALGVMVLAEILHMFIGFHNVRRVTVKSMLEFGMVFILRDMIIVLYGNHFKEVMDILAPLALVVIFIILFAGIHINETFARNPNNTQIKLK